MIDKGAKFCMEMLNDPEIIAEIQPDNVSWDHAADDQDHPFINFDVYDDGLVTKNPVTKVYGRVRVYALKMSEAAQISSVVRRVVKEKYKGVKDRGAKSGYTDRKDVNEAAVEILFELPKQSLT